MREHCDSLSALPVAHYVITGAVTCCSICDKVMNRSPLQAEARRFLSALGRRAAQSGNSFSVHQLFDLSDHLQLKVPDTRAFIDQLNDAGMPMPHMVSHAVCLLQQRLDGMIWSGARTHYEYEHH